MTRVDFYILAEGDAGGRERFACRVAEKAWRLGHRVYLHTEDRRQARRLDDLLWTFKQNSFLPHAIDGESPDPEPAVLIGCDEELSDPGHSEKRPVLINLASAVPLFFSTFERVAEIVAPTEQERADGRQRYRFYRDRGYPLQNHNIG